MAESEFDDAGDFAGDPPNAMIPSPRVGGGNDSTAWAGGPNQGAKRLSRPSSTMARRPTDFKSANTIEHIATKGRPADRHIGPDEKTSKITLTSWVNSTRSYMEERGMDIIFHVYDWETNSETYLLTDWGSASPAKIEAWVATLRAGVPKPDGTLLPPCNYDLDNLKWSGKAILNTVSLPLWETVEKDLGVDATGPEAFAAVVYKLQQVSSAAFRALADELKNLSLIKEPGQDVEIFGGRVVELCRRISGTGCAPPDLVVLAAATFLECDVLSFKLKAIKVHDEVDEDARAMSWDGVVCTLKTKYQSLKGQGLWTRQATSKKRDDELSGLHATFNKLAAQVGGGGGGGGGVCCYGCNELGHLSRDCPRNQGSSGSRTPPKDGEPHTKTLDGKSQSWCGICRRWTKGEKEHRTGAHIRCNAQGPEPALGGTSDAPPPAPAPAPAPAPTPAIGGLEAMDPYHGGGLHLHSGLFVAQLTKVRSENSSSDGSDERGPPLDDDPTLCHDDFFHVMPRSEHEPAIRVEDECGVNERVGIGMYMAENSANDTTAFEDPSNDITTFLTNVAKSRNVTEPNVESWVSAVESKLADIGIFTIAAEVLGAVPIINPTLFQAGHVPMYIRTLELMAREGVRMKRIAGLSVSAKDAEMTVFLHKVAASRHITGDNVERWADTVRAKLH
jgi:hypothetical protein